MGMGQAEQHGLARGQSIMRPGEVQPALAHQRMLDHQKRRVAALQPIPGVDFVDPLFVARAHRHAVQWHRTFGQRQCAHLVAMVDEVSEHKITLRGTSFLYHSLAGKG